MKGLAVQFDGVLGGDAQVRTSKDGKRYLTCSLAVGDMGDAAQWVKVLRWDDDIDELVDRLKKGVEAYVEGALKVDEYTPEKGEKRVNLTCFAKLIVPKGPHRRSSQRQRQQASGSAADSRPAPSQRQRDTRPLRERLGADDDVQRHQSRTPDTAGARR